MSVKDKSVPKYLKNFLRGIEPQLLKQVYNPACFPLNAIWPRFFLGSNAES